MITIPVKIKKEDKTIMIRILESVKGYPLDLDDLNRLIVYEIYLELLSKLRASQHNDKAIRLNLAQAQGFLAFINQTYSAIGDYELANAILLTEGIKREIKKKAEILIINR